MKSSVSKKGLVTKPEFRPVRFYSVQGFLLIMVATAFIVNGDSTQVRTKIGYTVAIESPTFRDDALISLAFRGGGLALGLIADHQINKWQLSEKCDFGMSYAANRFGHGGVQFRLWGQLAVDRLVYSSADRGDLAIGIPLNLRFNDWYLFSWDDAHLYWHTSHWTGINCRYNKELTPKWRVKGSIALPLVALISTSKSVHFNKQDALTRPGFWFSQASGNLSPATWGRYNGFDLSIGLSHPGRRSDMEFTGSYSYSFCTDLPQSKMRLIQIRYTQQWRTHQ